MLSSLNDKQVALVLTGQALSASAQQSLHAIRTKKTELATIAQAQQGRSNEIASIDKDQARVRENLKAVQAASGDKSLIARYTKQLATQEDRLEVLRRESSDAEAQQKAKQAELEGLIQALSVDVSVNANATGSTP
jgi:chromosome segregation ATPase